MIQIKSQGGLGHESARTEYRRVASSLLSALPMTRGYLRCQ
jgi:hypothetical protein